MEHPRWTATVGWALIVAGLLSMIVSAISSSSIDPDAFQETQGVGAGGPWMFASPFIAGMGVLIVAINKRLRLERVLLSLSVGIVGWLLVAPAGAAFSCSFTASGDRCEETSWLNAFRMRLPGDSVWGLVLGIVIVAFSAWLLLRVSARSVDREAVS
jgi:hypothetical protein